MELRIWKSIPLAVLLAVVIVPAVSPAWAAPTPQPSPTPDPYLAIEQATAKLVLDQEQAQKLIASDRVTLTQAEAALKKPKK